jgi:hypothetical protein
MIWTRDRLGGEDAAWLHMEEPTNPMVVTSVLELERRLPDASLRSLTSRLAATPRFRSRVVEPAAHVGPPRWEIDPSFDVSRHIERVALEGGEWALRAFVDEHVGTLLPRDRPLWHLHAIDRVGAGTALLFRVHHALGDGFGLLAVLLSLCESAAAASEGLPVTRPGAGRRRDLLRSFGRLATLPPDPRTPLKGRLVMQKRVAWTRPIPLASIAKIARRAHATVNDVLVAVVAGALRRYLARRGTPVEGLEVRAMVPVNLRTRDEATVLGNRFGLVALGLPIGVVDPLARVGAVHWRMKRLKRSREALVAHAVLRTMGVLPRSIEDLGVAFFARKASLVLTNVPGPRTRLAIDGIPVSRIVFWVPQSGRMGVGISIFSYAGDVTIGVIADAGLVADPDLLVDDLYEEHARLAGEVEDEPRTPRATLTPG